MQKERKAKQENFIETASTKTSLLAPGNRAAGLDFLVSFFSAIRPQGMQGKAAAEKRMLAAILALKEHPVLLTNLQTAILSQLAHTDLSPALTESGIPLARGFWQEFSGRVKHKLLPKLQLENDFLYVVNRVFFRKDDYTWVEHISHETWISFFQTIGLSLHVDDSSIVEHLLQSLKILAFQVAQLGLEKEVFNYLSQSDRESNPFVEQNYLIHDLEKLIEEDNQDEVIQQKARALELVLEKCYQCLTYIRENHSSQGTSLHQTYILIILENRMNRISILADMLDADQHLSSGKFVDFFKMLIRNENRKNSIREFLSQCLGYLAYQIAEHKGTKGNKYITSSRSEYRSMVKSAMRGGLVVCFVTAIKNILTKIEMPIFWHGFAYSVNYSAGFIYIEETHATLATKQPAFTASALASSLDTKKNTYRPNLENLASTVAKVSRSQIASFAGNLAITFPGSFLLAWIYDKVTGNKLVDPAQGLKTLEDIHPWHSLSLVYACNAGFFLFLSGIIAGYIQNKIQYSKIPERLQTHPILRLSMSVSKRNRLAQYIEKHSGAIIGNIALGFFLGMSNIVNKLFGIPFDVRHITISAGNSAIAVYGIGIANLPVSYLLTIFLGVLAIGFFNFLVSFSFAFLVAVKSRGVRLRDYPEFIGILLRYFFRFPLRFIRPPNRVAEAE